ncbi:MAG: winged helix-turn-helix domain-containing protein [Eubacteriales bacterium]|nr:winged helix-turn-helix domain-containing protein [Eubacteriales bacterium]
MEEKEKQTRPSYKRAPFGKKEKQVSRMAPVLEYLQKAGMPISEVAEKCGLTRQCINQRINLDDCNLSFMEQIADAAGYEFVWSWKKKRGVKKEEKES